MVQTKKCALCGSEVWIKRIGDQKCLMEGWERHRCQWGARMDQNRPKQLILPFRKYKQFR